MFKIFPLILLQFWSISILSQTTNQAPLPPILTQAVTTPIGTTTYDLQTNRGMLRRVAVNGEKVYATWTMSQSFGPLSPDRGTGFNSSNDQGDTWQTPPTTRLEEAYRTGWNNIGVTANGRIFSISHFLPSEGNSPENGLVFTWQDEGAENWQSKIIGGSSEMAWARVANEGNTIHIIATQTGGSQLSLRYFRSLDGGETWSKPMGFPAVSGVTADNYMLDVKDGVVAFVIGNESAPTVLYKSLDAGNTWQSTIINETRNYNWILLSSGQFSLIIDHEDQVHVWYDRMITLLGDSGVSEIYQPNNTCLMYWNEAMPTGGSKVLGLTVRMDYDGDGNTMIPINGDDAIEYRSYGKTLVGHPSAGIDAVGNLYVAYSSMRDGAREIERPDSRLYRDVYLLKSTDGGNTWQGPFNASNSPTTEDVYPSIQRNVGDFVHLVYQSDPLTGTAVNNANGNSGIGHNSFVVNTIYHVKISTEEIQTPEILNNTSPSYFPISSGLAPTAFEGCIPPIEDFDTYVLDFPDGDLSNTVEIGSTFDIDIAGDTGHWILSVSDSDGNAIVDTLLLSLGIETEVKEDSIPPLIFPNPFVLLQGETLEEAVTQFNPEESVFLFPEAYEVDVVVGTEYKELGAELFDRGQLLGCPPTLEIEGAINMNETTPEPLEITYTATDQAGNQSEWIRKVNVIGADLEPPIILLIFDDPLNPTNQDGEIWHIHRGTKWEDPGFYAYDNVDGDLTSEVVIGGDVVSTNEIGDYTVVYSVADNSGNIAQITRIVRVSAAPQIFPIGPNPLVLSCDNSYSEFGANAFDLEDGVLTNQIEIRYFDEDGNEIEGVCACCPISYLVTYTVTDSDGNVGMTERLVIIHGDCSHYCCHLLPCDLNIEESILQSNITLYPNPSISNHFFLDFKDLTHLQSGAIVEIYDVMGKLVHHQERNSNLHQTWKIDLTNIIGGVYFVKIQTSEGTISKKLVVR